MNGKRYIYRPRILSYEQALHRIFERINFPHISPQKSFLAESFSVSDAINCTPISREHLFEDLLALFCVHTCHAAPYLTALAPVPAVFGRHTTCMFQPEQEVEALDAVAAAPARLHAVLMLGTTTIRRSIRPSTRRRT